MEKIANDIVDRVYNRAHSILLDDHESMCEALLAKNDEITIHTQNLRVLIIEIYKTFNNTNPPFMEEYFIRKDVQMTSGIEICCTFLLQIVLRLVLIL